MTKENKKMKMWLLKNGIHAQPKYIKSGSLAGCWRIYNYKIDWWNNETLQNKLTDLGLVDFDGYLLSKYSGNGGKFSIFSRFRK